MKQQGRGFDPELVLVAWAVTVVMVVFFLQFCLRR